VVWIWLASLEQSALIWHQAVGYSVGKTDVFQKEIDKVRGKIVKIIKIFEKLEHITYFGSKITGHLLCRHSINYHLHLNSLSICNWSNIQKKITPDCCSSFSNILIILTILLLTLYQCYPAQEGWALKDQLCQNKIWT
jgi:hypothetical protein